MPRKKKGGQSPARFEGEAKTGLRSTQIAGYSPSTSFNEAIVRNMQEMFSHLDPEIIHIVLAGCNFKVEAAMDSLLELSNAAIDPQPIATSASRFEKTAAALLSQQTGPTTQIQSFFPSPKSVITEDMDFLLDQEVLSLNTDAHVERQLNGKFFTHHECPQSNLEPQQSGTSVDVSFESLSHQSSQRSGSSSPLDKLSEFESLEKQPAVVDDLPRQTFEDKSLPSTDVFMPSYPSLSKPCTQQNNSCTGDGVLKSSSDNRDTSVPMTWNILAPSFYPQMQEKTCPAFITPVVSNWSKDWRPAIPWHRPSSHTQLRPGPAQPFSWALPSPQPLGHSRLRLEGKVLVLLRGPPGAGKSTLARALLEHNPTGIVLSTDDFFTVNGQYRFDPAVLGEAHSWNHIRAKQAFERGDTPIIIDNTNMQGWEMKPYVVQALKHHYKILFREPDTWWKNKPNELERRTKHGVPSERIKRMLCGYERHVTVKSIMGSQMPECKQIVTETGENVVSCLMPEVPDAIAEISGKKQPHDDAAPSRPDVSTTTGPDCRDELEDIAMDMGSLDSELDKLCESFAMKSDSIAESVINNNQDTDEIPVAFSESIGQRLKRNRADKKCDLELAEKTEDAINFEEKDVSLQEENPTEERANSTDVKTLEFEGDWPIAALLDQRQMRRRERPNLDEGGPEKPLSNLSDATTLCANIKDKSLPDIIEFQKLDLIETGADTICTAVTPLSSSSPRSEDEESISCDKPPNQEHIVKKAITEELPDSVSKIFIGENEPDVALGTNENTISSSQVSESENIEEAVSGQSDDVLGNEELMQHKTCESGKQSQLSTTSTLNCLEAPVNPVPMSSVAQTNDGPSLALQTNIKSCAEAKPSSFTQTESKDFAVLWRVNENGSDVSDTPHSDFSILSCDPIRFVPLASVGVCHRACNEIPYTVVYEKSTQVEERELGPAQDILDDLYILRRHFKQVTLDSLEDLYEKCQRDLQWTSNLLLDSGERFFMDDESEAERSCAEGEEEQAPGGRPSSATIIDAREIEELAGSTPDVIVEEIENSINITSEPCANIDIKSSDSSFASNILDCDYIPQPKNYEKDSTIFQQINVNRAQLTPNNTHVGVNLSHEGHSLGHGVAGAEMDEGFVVHDDDDIRSINEVRRLLQAELDELEREDKEREEEKARRKIAKQKKKQLFDIKCVELRLPTELAFQLTELFGPVGLDPDIDSPEDCVLQMDLNLAKLLHQKWKESVQERQKQAALSFRLLEDRLGHSPGRFKTNSGPDLPLMDHWSVSQPHVSLRNIIKEESVLQNSREKIRQSQADIEKRDGAALIKEDQLFALFPTIDRHFLQDIFRDNNYSLTQTQLFLHSLLGEGPVKTVIAPEPPQSVPRRATSKDRAKSMEPDITSYQDTEDPEYQDFRAEANLQRRRQLESFAKAAEAYKQGHKEVASFYAQQGHLHGQSMHEANRRAAIQIFERVNSSLLPRNILDLHGLHVGEALEHLEQVLEQKTTECERGLCCPQLSVITGRGNHSQGGVARIRPAVLDYLTNKRYRFSEPKPGLVLVSLK